MITPFSPAAAVAAAFDYMGRTEDAVRGMFGADGVRWRWGGFATLDGFVASCGRPYSLGRRPPGRLLGPPKSCFHTARLLAERESSRLRYVEGMAVVARMPFPFHHAAVYDTVSRRVYELVLPDDDLPAVLIGIVFRPAALAGTSGPLLDNGRGGIDLPAGGLAAWAEDVPADYIPAGEDPERNRK